MTKDSVTYVTYSHGVDAKHISLGNLAHDPKNPKFYEPYVEKSYSEYDSPFQLWPLLSCIGGNEKLIDDIVSQTKHPTGRHQLN